MPRPPHGKDAEEELVDRSLTNVRALVDKLQEEERARQQSQRWIILSLVVVTLAVVGLVAFAIAK